MMHAESVADHSRHKAHDCKIRGRLSFSFWAPTDRHVLLNGDYGDQCWQQPECTFLSDKVAQFHVRTCKRWCRSCSLTNCGNSSRSVAVMCSNFRFRMTSRALAFKTDCRPCRTGCTNRREDTVAIIYSTCNECVNNSLSCLCGQTLSALETVVLMPQHGQLVHDSVQCVGRLPSCSVLVSPLSERYGIVVTAFAARRLDVFQTGVGLNIKTAVISSPYSRSNHRKK